jgi:hypothetical protein
MSNGSSETASEELTLGGRKPIEIPFSGVTQTSGGPVGVNGKINGEGSITENIEATVLNSETTAPANGGFAASSAPAGKTMF